MMGENENSCAASSPADTCEESALPQQPQAQQVLDREQNMPLSSTLQNNVVEYKESSLWFAILKEVSEIKRAEYGTCDSNSTVIDDKECHHPDKITFHDEIVVSTGGITSLAINGMATKLWFSCFKPQDIIMLNKFSNLKRLDITFSRLQRLEGFTQLLRLRVLNLTGNYLESLQGLPSLPSLEELNLWGNQLKTLQGMQKMPSLKCLILSNNRLAGSSNLELLPWCCPKLVELFIGKNQIQSAASLLALEGFKALEYLYVEGNPLVDSLTSEKMPHICPSLRIMFLRNSTAEDEGWVHVYPTEEAYKYTNQDICQSSEGKEEDSKMSQDAEIQDKHKTNYVQNTVKKGEQEGLPEAMMKHISKPSQFEKSASWLEQLANHARNFSSSNFGRARG